MIILGVESSCDETAAAVVRDGRQVLSSVVASQIDLHKKYGGVVPEIACRAHFETILPTLFQALDGAGVKPAELDAIAVTNGPGLIGALLIGLTSAKTLAWLFDRPLVAVNHVNAHLYAASMEHAELSYPVVGLIVSGGHTLLCKATSETEMSVIGSTVDDAAGEAFDKVASILGLGYPGGPAIDRAARQGDPAAIRFPRASIAGRPYDFSFSGLKTAVLYHCLGPNVRGPAPLSLSQQQIADVAASFQEAVIEVLVDKTIRAAHDAGVRAVALGGGVAANSRLRDRLSSAAAASGLGCFVPSRPMCLDNGAMIAGIGYHLYVRGRVAPMDVDAFAQMA